MFVRLCLWLDKLCLSVGANLHLFCNVIIIISRIESILSNFSIVNVVFILDL